MDTLEYKNSFRRPFPLFLDLLSHLIFLFTWLIWRFLFRMTEQPSFVPAPTPIPTPTSSWFWGTQSQQEPMLQEVTCKDTTFEYPFESLFGALLVIAIWVFARVTVIYIRQRLVRIYSNATGTMIKLGIRPTGTFISLRVSPQNRTALGHAMANITAVSDPAHHL